MVKSVRRVHQHAIDLILRKELIRVRVDMLYAKLAGELPGANLARSADGHDFNALDVRQSLRVHVCDHAVAKNTDPKHSVGPFPIAETLRVVVNHTNSRALQPRCLDCSYLLKNNHGWHTRISPRSVKA